MRMVRTQTIQVAIGMLPVNVSVQPQGYVGSWVDCFASWTPIAPKVGVTVTFDWGDGRQDVIPNIHDPPNYTEAHNYQMPGTFTVTVTVRDQYNNEGSAQGTVQIADKLTGFLHANPTSGNLPLPVVFEIGIDKGFLPYSWTLTTGDGGQYVGTEPHKTVGHEYVTQGTFTATLTVIDALGEVFSLSRGISAGYPGMVVPSLVAVFGAVAVGFGLIYWGSRR